MLGVYSQNWHEQKATVQFFTLYPPPDHSGQGQRLLGLQQPTESAPSD